MVDPKQFGEIILKTGTDGSVTRVKDVARIELGAADYTTNTHFDGKPAVGIRDVPIARHPMPSLPQGRDLRQDGELKKTLSIRRGLLTFRMTRPRSFAIQIKDVDQNACWKRSALGGAGGAGFPANRGERSDRAADGDSRIA